jgi:hypothetical protein
VNDEGFTLCRVVLLDCEVEGRREAWRKHATSRRLG